MSYKFLDICLIHHSLFSFIPKSFFKSNIRQISLCCPVPYFLANHMHPWSCICVDLGSTRAMISYTRVWPDLSLTPPLAPTHQPIVESSPSSTQTVTLFEVCAHNDGWVGCAHAQQWQRGFVHRGLVVRGFAKEACDFKLEVVGRRYCGCVLMGHKVFG